MIYYSLYTLIVHISTDSCCSDTRYMWCCTDCYVCVLTARQVALFCIIVNIIFVHSNIYLGICHRLLECRAVRYVFLI